MDINTLQAFTQVAEHGSFSEAAERLYLTQPAVSKRIAQLEEQLGVKLFDRIGRNISLTEAGRTLLPRARRLLNDATDIKRIVADLNNAEIAGRLTMATSHHIGLHRLPAPLKIFTQNYPKVELDIRFMDSEAACRAVEIGDMEIAIVTLPPKPMPQLKMETIWDDPLAFIVAKDHLLGNQQTINLKTLLEHPAVLPSTGTYTRAILEKAVREAGLSLHIGMSTNYLETLSMLVTAGLGWSLLPSTLISKETHALNVKGINLSRQLGVVTHEKRSLSKAAQSMISVCKG